MDFHTHNLNAPAGQAVVNLPLPWTERPELFVPREGVLYSAGLHPWWTADANATERIMAALPRLLVHPQVVALGECGLDALRGASLSRQEELFLKQLELAENFSLPVTLHIVKAYDRLLHVCKTFPHTVKWTVHGFRGKPALARQLLDAGLDLSFGTRRNEEAFLLTPPSRRHEESDEDY